MPQSWHQAANVITALFSLNFASTNFRDFRDFFKIAKFNTREI